MSELDLAALLASRLCHDLVGPVGALVNGVEVLAVEDDEAMRAQALALLEMSAEQASARLCFYRYAFGAAGDDVDIGEAAEVARQMLAAGRVALDWDTAPASPSMPAGGAKLALNLVIVATEALPRGGRVAVGTDGGGAGVTLRVEFAGPGAAMEEGARALLLDARARGLDGISPREVVAAHAARIAAHGGARVAISAPAVDTVLIEAVFPAGG